MAACALALATDVDADPAKKTPVTAAKAVPSVAPAVKATLKAAPSPVGLDSAPLFKLYDEVMARVKDIGDRNRAEIRDFANHAIDEIRHTTAGAPAAKVAPKVPDVTAPKAKAQVRKARADAKAAKKAAAGGARKADAAGKPAAAPAAAGGKPAEAGKAPAAAGGKPAAMFLETASLRGAAVAAAERAEAAAETEAEAETETEEGADADADENADKDGKKADKDGKKGGDAKKEGGKAGAKKDAKKAAKAAASTTAPASKNGLVIQPAPDQAETAITLRRRDDIGGQPAFARAVAGQHSWEENLGALLSEVDESESKAKALRLRLVEKENFMGSLDKRRTLIESDIKSDRETMDVLQSHIAAINNRVQRLKKERLAQELTAQQSRYAAAAKKLSTEVDNIRSVSEALQTRISKIDSEAKPLLAAEHASMQASLGVPKDNKGAPRFEQQQEAAPAAPAAQEEQLRNNA